MSFRGGKRRRGFGGGGDLGTGFGGEDYDMGEMITNRGGGFQSQDRGDNYGGGRGRGGGGGGGGKMGGSAGGGGSRSKAADEIVFQRVVPKFLQGHAHLLERHDEEMARKREESKAEFLARGTGDADEDDWAEEERAEQEELIRKAMAEDPTLAPEYRANEEKEKGNKAFSEKRFTDAIAHFSLAIELQPTNEAYWSNRSAAYCSVKDFDKAERDAKQCVKLKPEWPKGHSRLGAALFGSEDYEGAIRAYEKALELEPSNASVQSALEKAKQSLEKQQADGKIKFRSKKPKLQDSAAAAPGSTAAKLAALAAKLAGESSKPAAAGPKDERREMLKTKNVLSHLNYDDDEEED